MGEQDVAEALSELRRDVHELQQALGALQAWCAGLEQELERALRAAASQSPR
jgi:hypothetical protein